MTAMPLTMSEAQFQERVTAYATWRNWSWAHVYPMVGRDGRFITPVQGTPGFPDLVLARNGRVILAELKSHRGKASPQQAKWLTASGGFLWTPAHWDEIQEMLS